MQILVSGVQNTLEYTSHISNVILFPTNRIKNKENVGVKDTKFQKRVEKEQTNKFIESAVDAKKDWSENSSKKSIVSKKSTTAKKESSKPKGSILQLASNYDDSDQGESDDNSLENGEKKNLTQLDNYGRLVFGENSESNSDRQTEEQRKALEMYKIEESKNKKNTSAEVKTHTNRYFKIKDSKLYCF